MRSGNPPLTKLPGFPTLECNGAVVLLHQGAGSTIDHFLRGPLEGLGTCPLEMDSGKKPTASSLNTLLTAPLIVVVRYLPRDWLRPLGQAKAAGARLTYLMDDDLLDPELLAELPPVYRRRVRERITAQRGRVPLLFDRIWVTSGFLAQKYAHLGAELLPLHPHPSLLEERPRFQLAYLGTSVHQQEFAWLRELLALLQARNAQTHVDLFGDLRINRQFRELPRIRVLYPMAWPSYLAETGLGRVDVLLTPLLASPVNAARAPVKFVDAARLGAAGLYSDRPPYQGFIRQGLDGLLLGDNPWDWLQAIERLIDDGEMRLRLAAAARERALGMCRGGSPVGGAADAWETDHFVTKAPGHA